VKYTTLALRYILGLSFGYISGSAKGEHMGGPYYPP